MSRTGRPIRYKRNGPIWGLKNVGYKTYDQVTGFPTYKNYIGINDFGDQVDVRGDGWDRNQDYPFVGQKG